MTSINEIYFGMLPFHGLKAGGIATYAVQKIKEGLCVCLRMCVCT